jgi:transcriptional regulator with XRE-family HTH domain
MNELSVKLRELREKNELSQRELSKKLGLSQSTIGMYETGKREPNTEILTKIADFYGVSVDYLLDRDEETELPAYIMKVANDINNLPETRKTEVVNMVRNLIALVKDAEEEKKG